MLQYSGTRFSTLCYDQAAANMHSLSEEKIIFRTVIKIFMACNSIGKGGNTNGNSKCYMNEALLSQCKTLGALH